MVITLLSLMRYYDDIKNILKMTKNDMVLKDDYEMINIISKK